MIEGEGCEARGGVCACSKEKYVSVRRSLYTFERYVKREAKPVHVRRRSSDVSKEEYARETRVCGNM